MRLCTVCNHDHEAGVKCPICGHVGKCKVLQLLKKIDSINLLSFLAFRVDVHASPILGNWAFSRLLREHIFAAPMPFESPLFDNIDVINATKHILTFVGDAPIGTARWSFTYDNGVEVALIEKLGILDSHRNKRYGSKTLEYIVKDITGTSTEVGRDIYAIVANIPNDPSSAVWKTFLKCHFQPQINENGGVKMILYRN
ncbi:hypothetical protein THRCLA_21455 [Thraustotheca clavata]|uniref:N-acetyltransferase domain-containing protein n=1 Tax=Thraustotheca clavata TaxID=74557 RepID=A0A1V9ZW86_9STRA|nr:hypothetical protein THRCLA_21455 [Thraustotheca clavata]